jgi:hypothetical protein
MVWLIGRRLVVLLVVLLSVGCLADEVDDLLVKLKDLDPIERQSAAVRLAYSSEPSARVLAALLETVRTDPELLVQEAAVSAIGALAESASSRGPYLEALRELLASESPRLALSSAVALEALGDRASENARLALYKTSVDGEADLRGMAVQGLARNTGKESFAVLARLLDAAPLDQEVASALYDRVGSAGKDLVVSRIIRGLQAAQGDDFEVALSLAQRLPSGNEALLPHLEELTRTASDPATRLSLLLTLYGWEPTAARVAPLAQLLGSPEGATPETIRQIVGSVNTRDIKFLREPLLSLLTTSKDPDSLSLLIDALAVPGPGEKEALAAMLANRAHSLPLVRAKVAKGVSSLGPAAAGAVPALKELMKDSDLEVAVLAATSYFKLTGDRGPVLDVYRKAASSEEGMMALYNHLDTEVMALGDDLLGVLFPQAVAGNSTARQMLPLLLDDARPERLSAILKLYPDLDPSSRSMYIYSLSSAHVARPQVYDFLVKVSQSQDFQEALMAAQFLREKAGDTGPLIRLLRKCLTGSSEDRQMALGFVSLDKELCTELFAELLAALPTLSSDYERAQVLQGLYYADEEAALKALVEDLRAGRYAVLANFSYDTEIQSKIAGKLQPADIAKLGSHLLAYRKESRRWDEDLNQATFVCGLLRSLGPANATLAETLRWLAENHPNQNLRACAAEAGGGVDAP